MPTLGAHVLGQRCQLVAHQRFQHCGIGEVGSGIAFCEQVAADAACLPVGVQPDEAHQRVRGVDFAFGQALAQLGRAALPFRRTKERGFLRGVVVGDGQGHQLFQRDGSGAVVGHQARRDVGELQAALHHQRGHAEVGGNVLDGPAFLTSAANASNWSAGCICSRIRFSARLTVRAEASGTSRHGTS